MEKSGLNFLIGGGEMGDIIRKKDWASTKLGPPDTWPHTLKTILSTILNSKFPMFMWWGEDLICFYNDAYRPSLGVEGKHPGILGIPAREAWPEIWDIIKPLIDQVVNKGEATWSEDQLVPIYRNGKIEDVYWTFSYSPIYGDSASVEGVMVTCTETTQKVENIRLLQDSEKDLKFAIEATELGTWDLNPVTGTFKANKRLKEWFGIPIKEDIELQAATDAIIPEDRDRVIQAIQQALDPEGDGKYDITYTIINKKTGQERHVRAVGRAWVNQNKQVYRFNGTLQDNTETYKLEKERLQLVSLIEASHEFIGLTRPDLTVQYGNPAALKMLGWKTYKGKTVMDCIMPEDLEAAKPLMEQMYKDGRLSTEIRFRNQKTGKPFWLSWNAFEVKDPESGKVIGMGTVSTNIDEQRKREAALKTALDKVRENEEKFRKLVGNAPAAITICSGDKLIFELANVTALKILNKEESEVIGKTIWEILPEAREDLEPIIEEVFRTGEESKGIDFPILLNRRGTVDLTYFNFVFQPLFDQDGKVNGMMSVAMEVTDSVLLRNKLKESEKQFRNLVMQSPIPMTIFRGPDHRIEMANEIMLKEIWRKKPREVLGKKVRDVFPELADQKYPELLDYVYTTGKPLSDQESFAQVVGDDGARDFYVDYNYAPLFEVDGTVSGLMITVNDVTERVQARRKLEAFSRELERQVDERTELLRKANQRLHDSIRELERTNADLQSFAYVSSHDLQEPLRKIQTFTSRILDRSGELLSDKDQQDFSRINVAATRMRTLIEDVLAFSRTSNHQGKFKKVNLRQLLGEVMDTLSDKIDSAQATIEVGPLCTLKVIPYQIRQLFSNLIENSLKFAKEDVPPMIIVKSEKIKGPIEDGPRLVEGKEYCQLTVADNGIGFESHYSERIFDVFQRLHTREAFQGTGIGLAIVKKIVQHHDGHIIARSKPGLGTTICVYLPL